MSSPGLSSSSRWSHWFLCSPFHSTNAGGKHLNNFESLYPLIYNVRVCVLDMGKKFRKKYLMLSLVENGLVVLKRIFFNIDNVHSQLSSFQERCRPALKKASLYPKCLVPSLVENGQVVLKGFKGWQCMLNHLPCGKDVAHHLTNLNPLHQNILCVWLKLVQWFFKYGPMYIFTVLN